MLIGLVVLTSSLYLGDIEVHGSKETEQAISLLTRFFISKDIEVRRSKEDKQADLLYSLPSSMIQYFKEEA